MCQLRFEYSAATVSVSSNLDALSVLTFQAHLGLARSSSVPVVRVLARSA